jgi:hypothetical protein
MRTGDFGRDAQFSLTYGRMCFTLPSIRLLMLILHSLSHWYDLLVHSEWINFLSLASTQAQEASGQPDQLVEPYAQTPAV